MTPAEALAILNQARQVLQADWATHRKLASAVQVLDAAINSSPVTGPSETR